MNSQNEIISPQYGRAAALKTHHSVLNKGFISLHDLEFVSRQVVRTLRENGIGTVRVKQVLMVEGKLPKFIIGFFRAIARLPGAERVESGVNQTGKFEDFEWEIGGLAVVGWRIYDKQGANDDH